MDICALLSAILVKNFFRDSIVTTVVSVNVIVLYSIRFIFIYEVNQGNSLMEDCCFLVCGAACVLAACCHGCVMSKECWADASLATAA